MSQAAIPSPLDALLAPKFDAPAEDVAAATFRALLRPGFPKLIDEISAASNLADLCARRDAVIRECMQEIEWERQADSPPVSPEVIQDRFAQMRALLGSK